VVGEQPVLEPGAEHVYTSGAVLETPSGTMEGSYEMRDADGRIFQVRIPRFALGRPALLH
jgi:ApaG protein